MKTTVIISNYNYGKYIGDAIDSVLKQTYTNIEIIIIDDGSTDDSLELLNENYADNNKIKIISKENGGQLSTFNVAKKYINGDIVFFLDSDDIYRENYVEEILNAYENNKETDFIFCAYERFFTNTKVELVEKYGQDMNLGFSILSTIYAKEWVGSVTSTISMRRELFNKILPIPFEQDWITRADDCLVWGSSILGSKKYYLNKPLVLYKVHEENNYYGKQFSNSYFYKRELAINKLFSFFIDKIKGIDLIFDMISLEFQSINPKTFKSLVCYLNIVASSRETLFLKVRKMLSIIKIYYTTK